MLLTACVCFAIIAPIRNLTAHQKQHNIYPRVSGGYCRHVCLRESGGHTMQKHYFSCGELMKRINDTIEKHANNKLISYDITVSQFKMLMALHHTPEGTATLKELESFFGVAQSTAAGIAARLEKKNLVSSFSDPKDKRVKHIRLTDSGIAICENVIECITETERRLLSGLTSEEQEQLNRLLQKVFNTMKP